MDQKTHDALIALAASQVAALEAIQIIALRNEADKAMAAEIFPVLKTARAEILRFIEVIKSLPASPDA